MNLFDLAAVIRLDSSEYENGIRDAESKIKGLGSKIGTGLKVAGGVAAASVTAASVAVGKLAKDAVNTYAEFEQLQGGIETLFEDLSVDVGINAEKAYKTAGLSANQYMETAMSFAASLNQSLLKSDGNIARSAKITDQTIIDMADNANKMGTSMESIQTAYAGFAKQNYTIKNLMSAA